MSASIAAFDTIVHERRAVKAYDPAYRLDAETEKKLFELAQQTPSSFNIQHWRFVKVENPEIRAQLRAAAWDQAQVTEASLLLVLCTDIKAWEKNPARYWETAPQNVRDYLLPMIKNFYEGKEQLQRDEAMRSVGFVAQTLMLAAKAMGLDSCPMIGFDAQKVAEVINLPKDHAIGMMLAIGKGIKEANPKGGYLPLSEIIVKDRF